MVTMRKRCTLFLVFFFNQHVFISFVVLELGRVRLCVCLFDKRGFLKFRASFFNSRAGFDFEARIFFVF